MKNAVGALALAALFASIRAHAAPDPAPLSAADSGRGARIYLQTCATCHQSNGAGLADLDPALRNDRVVGQTSPKALIDVILRGSAAVPAGPVCQGGAMMPFAYLSNRDIAALATYVRLAFGGLRAPVTPAMVTAERSP